MGFRNTTTFALSTAVCDAVCVGIASACYQWGFIDGLQSRAATINSLEAELVELRHWKAVEHLDGQR
jgi:hypothetical protein